MPRQRFIWLAVATLSGTVAIAAAQSPEPAGPAGASPNTPSESYTQSQPAPVERSWSGPVVAPPPQTHSASNAQVIPGVRLRVGNNSNVTQVDKTPQRLELRVTRGIANINVHDPAKDLLILVDLPGGQAQLLKNGLYTFNAETGTVRVLKGEALAFPGDSAVKKDMKPIRIKEDHKVDFTSGRVRSEEFMPQEARADLVPGNGGPGSAHGERPYGYGPYGYGPYGDGYYGYGPYPYPYYAGYPWGWGWEPYGFYPYGVGIGFSYFGGYRGYGGFHGGGFRGHR